MEKEQKPRAFINIDTDLGKKRFFNIEDLLNWTREESTAWNELLQRLNTTSIRNIYEQWNTTASIINDINNSNIKYQEKRSKIKSYIEESIANFQLISSSNPVGKELLECRNNHEVEGFIEGLKDKPNQQIKSDHLRLSGYIRGQIFKHQSVSNYRSELSKVSKLIDTWSEQNEELLASLRETRSLYQSFLKDSESTNIEISERLESLKTGFNHAIVGLKNNYDNFLKTAHDSLNNVRETYEKHMSLRASVDYWSNQASEQKNKAERAFICLVVFTIATTLFFTLAGLYLVNSATPDELKMSAFNISYGHAIKAIIATLLLSFLIWAIKLSNKTWHIHKHLQHDATERVTMMKTYLALASEEKNLKENDVELILNSLFRPAYDGIIKDDTAPRSLADFFIREGK